MPRSEISCSPNHPTRRSLSGRGYACLAVRQGIGPASDMEAQRDPQGLSPDEVDSFLPHLLRSLRASGNRPGAAGRCRPSADDHDRATSAAVAERSAREPLRKRVAIREWRRRSRYPACRVDGVTRDRAARGSRAQPGFEARQRFGQCREIRSSAEFGPRPGQLRDGW